MRLRSALSVAALAAGLALAQPADALAQPHRHQRGCGHAGYGGGYRNVSRPPQGYRAHGYAHRPYAHARPYAYGYRPHAYVPLPYAPTYGYAPAYGAPYPYAPYPPAYGYGYGAYGYGAHGYAGYGYRGVPWVAPAPYGGYPQFSLRIGGY
jgi:hypothetical protein